MGADRAAFAAPGSGRPAAGALAEPAAGDWPGRNARGPVVLSPEDAGARNRPPRPPAGRGRHAPPPRSLDRTGRRFGLFSVIGGVVFLAGLALQAALTSVLHLPPMLSFAIQAAASVEASYGLNRWLTWRDRGAPFWASFVRFNAQKAVTVALNLALYAVLLRLGVNYLLANIGLTAVFTVVNYVAGDRFVFISAKAGPPAAADVLIPEARPARSPEVRPAATPEVGPEGRAARRMPAPGVSVVIPCRNNQLTIGETVWSLLDQDYPGLREIILVGSPGDQTWDGLEGIRDSRVTVVELETPPGVRDANFKRDHGIRRAGNDLIALVDSDIVLPPDWMRTAVITMQDSGAQCVAGGMRSIHDTFWGRYTDTTVIGAKTPRVPDSYTVTAADFGVKGRKPPISANVLFTRTLYMTCPINPRWSHGSYEDYEWFWRVTKAGYTIRVSRNLYGWHHHRRGVSRLVAEYRRSSRGCAYFIRAHMDSPFARRRLRQAIMLPGVALVGLVAAAATLARGEDMVTPLAAAALLTVGLGICAYEVARTRRLEAAAYPVLGAALGLVFTVGLITHLAHARVPVASTATAPVITHDEAKAATLRPRWRRYLLHPLAAILVVQAGLSLSLIWSNTAFSDEADYLWVGRTLIGYWLQGTAWPSTYAHQVLSGSPFLYPPIGGAADMVGGLAGARALSLIFMLVRECIHLCGSLTSI